MAEVDIDMGDVIRRTSAFIDLLTANEGTFNQEGERRRRAHQEADLIAGAKLREPQVER